MGSFICWTTIILLLSLENYSGAVADSVCSASIESSIGNIVKATTPKARLEVTTNIITSITPSIVSSIPADKLTGNSNDQLQVVYTAIAEDLGQKSSVVGFNQFVEAVNEISVAQTEACSGSASYGRNDVRRLTQEFNLAFGANIKDLKKLRSIFGTLLCIDGGGPAGARKRRQGDDCPAREDCTCPPEGLEGDFWCTCEFFECLDPDDVLKPIFGFATLNPEGEQCLAFVVDTTGSMGAEIDSARTIINEFIHREEELGELGCYILVPFNDVDDSRLAHHDSVGPVTHAYPFLPDNVNDFIDEVNSLTAFGGGDGPEYALHAMLVALRATDTDDDGNVIPLMVEGSQLILITDAPSKQLELKDQVISEANDG